MGIVVKPKVSFYYSLKDVVTDADRAAAKAAVKLEIEAIDPILAGDPAGTVRHKWDSLTPVHADAVGHIDKKVAEDNLKAQVALLGGAGYGVGTETEWCYLVRGGEIYCYHCYQLTDDKGVQVKVHSGTDVIEMSVAYSWAAPF